MKGVKVPEFVPDEELEQDEVEGVQASLQATAAAQGRRAGKIEGTVSTHEVDTGDEPVHGSVGVVETEQDLVEWQDPSNLDAPPAREGFVQRWVRSSFRSGQDPGNVTRAFREGWRPRKLDTVPREFSPPTIISKSLGNVIGVEGLVLCEMPVALARQRARFYGKQTAVQTEAIERDVHKEESRGNPIIAERRSRVTKGRYPQTE